MAEVRRFLVVANRTLGGRHLAEKVRDCMAAQPCFFHVVVPASPPEEHAWTEGEARAAAQSRLEAALVRFHGLGADADGEVGDANPLTAIQDTLHAGSYDEIILSTLPPGPSWWLKLDLPQRAEVRFGLPVAHVVSDEEPAPGEPQ